jgi:hypothetical protein
MIWLILAAWALLQPTVVWLAYSRAIHKYKACDNLVAGTKQLFTA